MPHLNPADLLLEIEFPRIPPKSPLVLTSFSGREAISELFSFDLDLISEDGNLRPADFIGQPVIVKLAVKEQVYRYFHGYISEFFLTSTTLEDYPVYQARMVPWLWFLTLTSDCAIYQKTAVDGIFDKVLTLYGFQSLRKLTITGTYPPREYCVQYRESAFQFLSRLLEEEGIFYYFDNADKEPKLILADSPDAHLPCPERSSFTLDPVSSGYFHPDEDYIQVWNRGYRFGPGRWAQVDFNFERPNNFLLSTQHGRVPGGGPVYERFDYPGRYPDRNTGDRLTKARMQEDEAGYDVVEGAGECRTMRAGFRFQMTGHPVSAQNGSYVLTSVIHHAQQSGFRSGAPAASSYRNRFTAIPYGTQFRPRRVTPKPFVQGSQTALVVGPTGEELYTDEYGRVKVQFHWDRNGTFDENSSCWIRVTQKVAGKGWGELYLPRVGQEVVVDFLEGDPDRPIITGCVYNAYTTVPYALPDNQTISTFKSQSTKGGDGFNEIRLDDKKDSEQIFIHGQKDLDLRVKNDRLEWIGRDAHLVVKRDKIEQTERDEHGEAKRDRIVKIGRDHHLDISRQAGGPGRGLAFVHGERQRRGGVQGEPQRAGRQLLLSEGLERRDRSGFRPLFESGRQLHHHELLGYPDTGHLGDDQLGRRGYPRDGRHDSFAAGGGHAARSRHRGPRCAGATSETRGSAVVSQPSTGRRFRQRRGRRGRGHRTRRA